MEICKKAYLHLVGVLDEALTAMETGDLLQQDKVKEMMSKALLEAEELVVEAPESP